MPNVQATKLASKTSAVTHALEHVATMQDVLQSITMPSVTVQLATQETPSPDVPSFLKSSPDLRSSIPATLHLVVLMLSALRGREQGLVDVFLITLVTPMWAADLSVSSTRSAPTTWPAYRRNVKTRAREPAAEMPSVQ